MGRCPIENDEASVGRFNVSLQVQLATLATQTHKPLHLQTTAKAPHMMPHTAHVTTRPSGTAPLRQAMQTTTD